MTKSFVLEKLQIATDTELAEIFGITRSAVGQWPDDEPIPLVRQYELKAKRPEAFWNTPVVEPSKLDQQAA